MKGTAIFSSVLSLFLLFSCLPPTPAVVDGALTVNFSAAGVVNRTILPDVDMNVAAYTVTGAGPNEATFQVNTAQTSVTLNGLAFGDWTVTVEALNAAGIVIGSGTDVTTVHTGESSTVDITVTPLSGFGSLDLTVTWNAGDTDIPSIDAELIPASGATRTLGFTIIGRNIGLFHADNIPTGYHTLVVKLLDNGLLTMGAVDVVRIVKGGQSTGTFDFPEINKPGGTIVVNVTPQMADPLTVTIAGNVNPLIQGQSMTVTGNVAEAVGNVVFVWYLNGIGIGTGQSLTFGGALAAGIYRLDVTAVTADGLRAGSATASFNVSM
jgi:hypothetical protein